MGKLGERTADKKFIRTHRDLEVYQMAFIIWSIKMVT